MSRFLRSALLMSSLALTGCNLSHISTIEDPKIALNNPYSKIEDDSKIGKYFLSDDERSIDEAGVMDELEERLEYSASSYFGRNVEFSTPYFLEAGQRIILAKRGELGIIDVQSEPFYQLTSGQKMTVKYLAEREGLNVSLDSLNSLEELVKKKPLYSAIVSDLGGFAFSLLFTHVIVMDNGKRRLYGVANTLVHEPTHHFIEMAEPYFQLPVIFYPNERMGLVETACDVIGDKVMLQFEIDHLWKGSELYKHFIIGRERNEKVTGILQNAVKQFNEIPLEKRMKERNKIFRRLSKETSRQLGKTIKLNEANLSLAQRYSGKKERYNQMVEIADTIGPTKFISLISDVYTDKQLKVAHHYVVDLGASTVEFLRNKFRKKDTDWPGIL